MGVLLFSGLDNTHAVFCIQTWLWSGFVLALIRHCHIVAFFWCWCSVKLNTKDKPWVLGQLQDAESVSLSLKDNEGMAGMQVDSKESGNQGPEHIGFSHSDPISFLPLSMAQLTSHCRPFLYFGKYSNWSLQVSQLKDSYEWRTACLPSWF